MILSSDIMLINLKMMYEATLTAKYPNIHLSLVQTVKDIENYMRTWVKR